MKKKKKFNHQLKEDKLVEYLVTHFKLFHKHCEERLLSSHENFHALVTKRVEMPVSKKQVKASFFPS
jgi:hypothetical protein